MEQKMKKTKIIVYHNIIQDKKIFIVVFIGQPLDFDRAKEVLRKYSSLVYSIIPTGENAITFIEKTDEFQRKITPYSDTNSLIASILFYENTLKALHELESL